MTTTPSSGNEGSARRLVRHFGASFADLDRRYPGDYPRTIVEGKGAFLIDEQGHRLLDAGNHLGVCVVGHGREDMATAMSEQVVKLEFAALDGGVSHRYVLDLARALAPHVPVDDPIFSFTSSGSEANELAIKIARDHFRRKGSPQRTKILTRSGSYHGSSYGAMTATAIPGFRDAFRPLVPDFVELPQPYPGHCGFCPTGGSCVRTCLDETARIIEKEGPETIAAILAEPISIPGAVKIPTDDYWPRLRELCDEHGILLISDEVVCGFGRTGRWFGVDHWDVKPDIMTMAKGLTSGYIPMGAVAVSRKVQGEFEEIPLTHLNTFAGHPVACAAALQTLAIMTEEDLVQRASDCERLLRDGLDAAARELPWPAHVSVRGLIGSIEIQVPAHADLEALRAAIWHACYDEGLLLRVTKSNQAVSIIFYPPLVVETNDLIDGLKALRVAVATALKTTREGSLETGRNP